MKLFWHLNQYFLIGRFNPHNIHHLQRPVLLRFTRSIQILWMESFCICGILSNANTIESIQTKSEIPLFITFRMKNSLLLFFEANKRIVKLYTEKDSGSYSPLFLTFKYSYSNNRPVIALKWLSSNNSSGENFEK